MGKIEKAKNTAVSTNVIDFAQDAGAGFEQMDEGDMKIPYIKIAEKMSPEIDEGHAKYIEGLKPGKFFNSVTNKAMDTIEVIPCHYERQEVIWEAGGGGGAPISVHHPSEGKLAQTQRNHENKDIMPDGTELIVTGKYLVLVNEGDGNWYPAVMAWSKTKLTAGRRWNSQMASLKVEHGEQKITPPMFGTRWLISTNRKTKDDKVWFAPDFEYNGLVDDANLYADAKKFREQAANGEVKVDYKETANDKNAKENDEAF